MTTKQFSPGLYRDVIVKPEQVEQKEEQGTVAADLTDREVILNTARGFVMADRNADYDNPEQNFERIAELWNVVLENAMERGFVMPYEVATAMACVKLARIVTSPGKQDHWVDLAGYAACGYESVPEIEKQGS